MKDIYEARVFKKIYTCDNCNQFELHYTGVESDLNGVPMYEHRCNNCEDVVDLDDFYPETIYIAKEEVR